MQKKKKQKKKNMLAKQPYCIQTKMYRLYKKWPYMVIFLNKSFIGKNTEIKYLNDHIFFSI